MCMLDLAFVPFLQRISSKAAVVSLTGSALEAGSWQRSQRRVMSRLGMSVGTLYVDVNLRPGPSPVRAHDGSVSYDVSCEMMPLPSRMSVPELRLCESDVCQDVPVWSVSGSAVPRARE